MKLQGYLAIIYSFFVYLFCCFHGWNQIQDLVHVKQIQNNKSRLSVLALAVFLYKVWDSFITSFSL